MEYAKSVFRNAWSKAEWLTARKVFSSLGLSFLATLAQWKWFKLRSYQDSWGIIVTLAAAYVGVALLDLLWQLIVAPAELDRERAREIAHLNERIQELAEQARVPKRSAVEQRLVEAREALSQFSPAERPLLMLLIKHVKISYGRLKTELLQQGMPENVFSDALGKAKQSALVEDIAPDPVLQHASLGINPIYRGALEELLFQK